MKTKLLLYCTKRKPYLIKGSAKPMHSNDATNPFNFYWHCWDKKSYTFGGFNGKIVVECECDTEKLLELATESAHKKMGYYALHLSDVKVLEEPLELEDCKHLKKPNCDSCPYQYEVDCDYHKEVDCENEIPVTEAPQNMLWVWYKCQKYCLISIGPEQLCKILNGELDVIVRKKVLKEML